MKLDAVANPHEPCGAVRHAASGPTKPQARPIAANITDGVGDITEVLIDFYAKSSPGRTDKLPRRRGRVSGQILEQPHSSRAAR